MKTIFLPIHLYWIVSNSVLTLTLVQMLNIYSCRQSIFTCLTRIRIKVSDMHNNISIELLYVVASSYNLCRLWNSTSLCVRCPRKGKKSRVRRDEDLIWTSHVVIIKHTTHHPESREGVHDKLARDKDKNLWRFIPQHPWIIPVVRYKEQGGKINKGKGGKNEKINKNTKGLDRSKICDYLNVHLKQTQMKSFEVNQTRDGKNSTLNWRKNFIFLNLVFGLTEHTWNYAETKFHVTPDLLWCRNFLWRFQRPSLNYYKCIQLPWSKHTTSEEPMANRLLF